MVRKCPDSHRFQRGPGEDIVPEGDHGEWIPPPFSGDVADGCVWGRGCTDSKMNILAYMEALEALIANGFEPDYDLYVAFGQNEEIMGGPEPGAGAIAALLKKRGVELGCVIDECGGPIEGKMLGLEGVVSQVYVAEKGYADFEFSKTDIGGHSSQPESTAPWVSSEKLLLSWKRTLCPTG